MTVGAVPENSKEEESKLNQMGSGAFPSLSLAPYDSEDEESDVKSDVSNCKEKLSLGVIMYPFEPVLLPLSAKKVLILKSSETVTVAVFIKSKEIVVFKYESSEES